MGHLLWYDFFPYKPNTSSQITDLVQERSGTDLDDALTSLEEYKDNIYVIEQLVQNDVSSTKIRMFVKRGMFYSDPKKDYEVTMSFTGGVWS